MHIESKNPQESSSNDSNLPAEVKKAFLPFEPYLTSISQTMGSFLENIPRIDTSLRLAVDTGVIFSDPTYRDEIQEQSRAWLSVTASPHPDSRRGGGVGQGGEKRKGPNYGLRLLLISGGLLATYIGVRSGALHQVALDLFAKGPDSPLLQPLPPGTVIAADNIESETPEWIATPKATLLPTRESSPTPTAIPCVKGVPELIGNVQLYFSCLESDADRQMIHTYIAHAESFAPPDVTMFAVVHVTTEGDSYGGESGYKESNLRIPPKYWMQTPDSLKHEIILHEMFHVLQGELSRGVNGVPEWIVEGGAKFYAKDELRALGEQPFDRLTYARACKETLDGLTYKRAQVGLIEWDCFYEEGALAVGLLDHYGGEDRYFELFRQMYRIGVFKVAFNKAYDGLFTYDQFKSLFDAYQQSGYETMSPLSEN